jgi:hypothetical protein
MKDLVVLRTSADVIDFVRGLWRTTIFQRSAYVDEWVQRLSRHPVVFAEMSDVELEHPHFATWFGMTYRRTYADPTISDLYYLHELVHACLLTYEPAIRFTAWYRKMTSVELTASLETECYVYLREPELRAISFADEIWADRYLGGGQSRLGDSLRDVIRQDRYRAMSQPDPMDYCEQQIAAYARQNFEWANGWKVEVAPARPAYREVEEHMAAFRAGAISVDRHADWLWQAGDIPFGVQARLFAPVYWKNKISVKVRATPAEATAP